jgi:predicted lipoprotein with Yx(FWY)xxD motif
MKKMIMALGLIFSFSAPVFALSQAECEAKAVSKDGKPLYGAAKDASIKKCMGDAKPNDCEAKAVSKDGKPLYGAAKDASIKKCMGGK